MDNNTIFSIQSVIVISGVLLLVCLGSALRNELTAKRDEILRNDQQLANSLPIKTVTLVCTWKADSTSNYDQFRGCVDARLEGGEHNINEILVVERGCMRKYLSDCGVK